ncbi:MAG: hypothetical protein R3348_06465 [Xanthomonadales bacterium]|nr:hypothetical protein [Xanthomonadales bacterium]
MPDQPAKSSRPDHSDASVSARVEALIADRPPSRTLLLAADHAGPTLPDWPILQAIEICGESPPGPLLCRFDALPFPDDLFELVMLSSLVFDGGEPIYQEACRVLQGGGHIIICGPGRAGSRSTPSIRPGRLLSRLRSDGYRVRDCEGHGLMGSSRSLSSAWTRPLVGWCSSVLIRAQHWDERHSVTPILFDRPGAKNVAAALDSVSREAAG